MPPGGVPSPRSHHYNYSTTTPLQTDSPGTCHSKCPALPSDDALLMSTGQSLPSEGNPIIKIVYLPWESAVDGVFSGQWFSTSHTFAVFQLVQVLCPHSKIGYSSHSPAQTKRCDYRLDHQLRSSKRRSSRSKRATCFLSFFISWS